MSKKILIIGASGTLARALNKLLMAETDHSLYYLSSKDIKFTEDESRFIKAHPLEVKNVKNFCFNVLPDVIINCSGFSDVVLAENERKLAWDLNVRVVENLVNISKIIDSHLVLISSDLVFDGMKGPYYEDTKPKPLNYYGKTKHTAENISLTTLKKITVVRTTPFYGFPFSENNTFLDDYIYKLYRNYWMNASDFLFTNPCFVDDLTLTIMKLIDRELYGVFNTGGPEWLSHYDFATKVADIFNFNKKLIHKIKNPFEGVKMPLKAGLLTLKTETNLSIKFTPLENGLTACKYRYFDK